MQVDPNWEGVGYYSGNVGLIKVADSVVLLLLLFFFRTDPNNGHTKLDVRHPAHLDHGGGAQVWRLSWNVTGTVLAS